MGVWAGARPQSGQSLSACYRIWKARGRPASRRTSSTVDVLALRHPLQWDGGDGGTMARKRRAPNYTGALAQPIYVEDYYKFTGGLGQPIQASDIAAIIKERAQRVQLLFGHYKIDLSDEQRWQRLAMRLALAHVPGLQVANRPKRGRKPTWKTGLGDELVRAVEDVMSRTGKSTKEAI